MTSVPAEIEEAAREVLKLYDVTEEEADLLASDHRFAVTAYLRRETGEWIDALGLPVVEGEIVVEEDGEIDLSVSRTVDGGTPEGRAVALSWFGYNAYVEASEAIAEAILGREIEENPVIERVLRKAIVKQGGEA